MIAPEEVARKYRVRPGYRLADYGEVGLPIYTITVRALTIARKEIPPTEELLKSLDRGLSRAEEIAGFLGLEQHVVKEILISLAQSESIALLAEPGSRTQSLCLTQKGRLTLEKAETELPEERIFSIHYDALLRRPAWYGRLESLKFEDLQSQGLIEIQAFPPKRPRVADLDVSQLGRVIRSLGNADEYRRELVAVKSIERVQKLFLPGLALVYVALDGDDVQVGFAVDGKLTTEHENAFARMDGPRKQGIVKSIRSRPPESELVEGLKRQLGIPGEELKKLETTAVQTETTLLETREKLASAQDSGEQKSLEDRLRILEEEYKKATDQLAQAVVQNLYTHDHPVLLEDALNNSKTKLLVISPWIRGEVVDSTFVLKLEVLLKRNVEVYIGYGIQETPTENPNPRDQLAKESLLKLMTLYPHFRFVRLGNTHAKVLIKDSEFAVVGSFNWLSFKGDPSRKFRDEQSIKIQRPDLVDKKFQELAARFS